MCEYIITFDKEFFNSIGAEETKRYFETAYKFVSGYKKLGEQYAFYNYIKSNNFNLERGKEEARVHLSVEEYKKITGFENSKTVQQDIELQLPDVPNIKDIHKIMLGRDEKVEELIIKPKDKLIEKLHQENCSLHHELYKQCRLVDKAEKYEKERQSILVENDYAIKLKQEIRKVENKYEDEIYNLKKENRFLTKIINTFEKTVNKFIKWIVKKFDIAEEDNLIRDFEKKHILLLIQKSRLTMKKNLNIMI